MAKKKKTREQKILAEIHRKNQLTAHREYSFISSNDEEQVKQEKPQAEQKSAHIKTRPNDTSHYQYLIHVFRKTAIVTGVIIVLQLILHQFIK